MVLSRPSVLIDWVYTYSYMNRIVNIEHLCGHYELQLIIAMLLTLSRQCIGRPDIYIYTYVSHTCSPNHVELYVPDMPTTIYTLNHGFMILCNVPAAAGTTTLCVASPAPLRRCPVEASLHGRLAPGATPKLRWQAAMVCVCYTCHVNDCCSNPTYHTGP